MVLLQIIYELRVSTSTNKKLVEHWWFSNKGYVPINQLTLLLGIGQQKIKLVVDQI
jgi:hypothetical protein